MCLSGEGVRVARRLPYAHSSIACPPAIGNIWGFHIHCSGLFVLQEISPLGRVIKSRAPQIQCTCNCRYNNSEFVKLHWIRGVGRAHNFHLQGRTLHFPLTRADFIIGVFCPSLNLFIKPLQKCFLHGTYWLWQYGSCFTSHSAGKILLQGPTPKISGTKSTTVSRPGIKGLYLVVKQFFLLVLNSFAWP